MADAESVSFTKQIIIQDDEVTITTNATEHISILEGDGTVQDVISLTQAEYDALTPVATTLYVIVG